LALIKGQKKPRVKNAKTIQTPYGLFQSQAEYERFCDLLLLQASGAIADLKRQVAYPVEINGVHICVWLADYVYTNTATGKVTAEDCKGHETDIFKLKKKMIEAYHNIKILITPARRMDKRRTVWPVAPKSKRRKKITR
jgi:hypothetical protein